MKKNTRYIGKDEYWPLLTFYPDDGVGVSNIREIPDNLVARYRSAARELEGAQQAIDEYLLKTKQKPID